MIRARYGVLVLLLGLLATPVRLLAADNNPDPHYTRAGFFDIHVCNWPKQPLFFLALFSTRQFNDIASVEIAMPDGTSLGQLRLDKYRIVMQKGKTEKRVFLRQIDVPKDATDGWYRARITLNNGEVIEAKDYVILDTMARADKLVPANDAEDIPVPTVLRWAPIKAARYYQVYIKDLWNGGQQIYTSALLQKPELQVPKGLLQANGLYSWRVHARDVNEHVLLGDFNHGSLSSEARFSTAP
jgi:hypothetical protein